MVIKERFAKETAREYALRVIKYNIVTLELEPGTLVSENELAKQIGVSRTPIREALIELSKANIVEIYPQRGSIVSKIDIDMVEEARFIRLTLEKAIAELACEYATPENIASLEENVKLQEFYASNSAPNKLLELDNTYHEKLFEICNKKQSYFLMNGMMVHFDRVRSMSLQLIRVTKIVEDHKQLLKAIKEKDKDKAKQVMTEHLSRYKIDTDELQQKYKHYFK